MLPPGMNLQTFAPAYIAEDLRPLAVPIAELVPDPKNARTHDEANLVAIAASLREFGQVKPIVVNRRNGQIVAGNGTYLAAQRLGWTHLAAVRVDQDPAAQHGYAVADNRTAELAAWDPAVLAELIGSIQEDSPDLYYELALESVLPVPEPAQEDEPSEGGGKKAGAPGPQRTYQVVVECEDAHDRRRLMAKLRRDGRHCRALTWEGAEQS